MRAGLRTVALAMMAGLFVAARAGWAADAPAGLVPAVMLRGHDLAVRDGAFSPDGKLLATTGDDMTVRLSDPQTGKEVAALAWPGKAAAGQSLLRVVFSPDGSLVAAGGRAPRAVVWEVASRKVKAEIDLGNLGSGAVLALSPDNRTLAANGNEATVSMVNFFDIATGAKRVAATLKDPAVAMAFSHDGKMLACGRGLNGGGDNLVVVDPSTGKELWSLKDADYSQVTAVAFSPDGRTLATTCKWEKLWDVATRREKTTPHAANESNSGTHRWLTFTRDGKSLVSDRSGFAYLNGATAAATRTFTVAGNTATKPLAVSPDGTLAAGAIGRLVKIWKLAGQAGPKGALQAMGGASATPIGPWHDGAALVVEGHEDAVMGMVFSPDGSRLFSVASDGTMRSWDARTGAAGFSVPPPGTSAALAMVDDGKRLLLGANLFDAKTGKADGTLEPRGYTQTDGVIVAARANVAAAPSSKYGVTFWNVPKLREGVTLGTGEPRFLALSPDGGMAYTQVYSEPDIRVFNTTNGTEAGKIPCTDTQGLSMSPDGKLLAAMTPQGLRLISTETMKDVGTVKGVRGTVVFSPDGKMLLTNRGLVPVLLEVPTLKDIAVLDRPAGMLRGAFSPDGKYLAVAQVDRIRVMKVEDVVGGK